MDSIRGRHSNEIHFLDFVHGQYLAVPAVMVVLSFAGKSDIPADIGFVHDITAALFYAFGANARSLPLNPISGVSGRTMLGSRLLLLLPVGLASFLDSTQLGRVEILMALILVVWRCAEWIAEISASEMDSQNIEQFAIRFLLTQAILTGLVILWLLGHFTVLLLCLIGAVLFLLVVDNSFKIGMRQPYSW